MIITPSNLKKIIPAAKQANLDKYADSLNRELEGWTKQSAAAFIAQIAHESGSLKYVREIESGAAYEGRKDLGNIEPGDGVKFKGRGLIQITGRNNYKACSISIFGAEGMLLHAPELLEQPKYAVKSAIWFWNTRNLSDIMNKPDDWVRVFRNKTYNRFEWVTLKINGGQNGIKERKEFFERALSVL